MINILSFYRKKRNKYFLIIILLFSLFNCFIYYKYLKTDILEYQDKNVFLIVDKKLHKKIKDKYEIKSSKLNKSELNNYNIDTYENTYYKIYFNRISLYEKYKEEALVLVINNFYDSTLNNMKFYKYIVIASCIISFVILVITIFLIIYYEKNNIYLLKIVGYKPKHIFQIYFINIIILILPSILIYFSTFMLLNL